LLPDAEELKELLRGATRFRANHILTGALPPRNWLDQTRYLSGSNERGYRWSVPYLITLADERLVVGSIGGKGVLDVESEVEIGYNVAPSRRGRGIATTAIRRLADIATGEGITLLAHTLPDNLASQNALLRGGFTFDEVMDLPDGIRLQRWSKSPD
jgi:RimJ/RimL family protein N-acetyltransferase